MNHEIAIVAGAQLVFHNEGNTRSVGMQDIIAPPGSEAISRMKGYYRNLGGPARANFAIGGEQRGTTIAAAITCWKSDQPIISVKSSKATR